MAEMLIQSESLTALADKIRVLKGTTESMSLDKMEAELDIPKNDSSDLTASGATVTAPAGYYASSASKSVATATQATPSISIDSAGKITASATQSAGYVSAGTKTGTKQLTTQAAKTITPTTSSQTAVASGVYTTGAVTVGAIPSTYVKPTATKSATTYTPTTSNQTIAAGTYCSGAQTIKGDANLVPENIASGVSIFGVEGTMEAGSGSGGGVEFDIIADVTNNIPETLTVNGIKIATGETKAVAIDGKSKNIIIIGSTETYSQNDVLLPEGTINVTINGEAAYITLDPTASSLGTLYGTGCFHWIAMSILSIESIDSNATIELTLV